MPKKLDGSMLGDLLDFHNDVGDMENSKVENEVSGQKSMLEFVTKNTPIVKKVDAFVTTSRGSNREPKASICKLPNTDTVPITDIFAPDKVESQGVKVESDKREEKKRATRKRPKKETKKTAEPTIETPTETETKNNTICQSELEPLPAISDAHVPELPAEQTEELYIPDAPIEFEPEDFVDESTFPIENLPTEVFPEINDEKETTPVEIKDERRKVFDHRVSVDGKEEVTVRMEVVTVDFHNTQSPEREFDPGFRECPATPVSGSSSKFLCGRRGLRLSPEEIDFSISQIQFISPVKEYRRRSFAVPSLQSTQPSPKGKKVEKKIPLLEEIPLPPPTSKKSSTPKPETEPIAATPATPPEESPKTELLSPEESKISEEIHTPVEPVETPTTEPPKPAPMEEEPESKMEGRPEQEEISPSWNPPPGRKLRSQRKSVFAKTRATKPGRKATEYEVVCERVQTKSILRVARRISNAYRARSRSKVRRTIQGRESTIGFSCSSSGKKRYRKKRVKIECNYVTRHLITPRPEKVPGKFKMPESPPSHTVRALPHIPPEGRVPDGEASNKPTSSGKESETPPSEFEVKPATVSQDPTNVDDDPFDCATFEEPSAEPPKRRKSVRRSEVYLRAESTSCSESDAGVEQGDGGAGGKKNLRRRSRIENFFLYQQMDIESPKAAPVKRKRRCSMGAPKQKVANLDVNANQKSPAGSPIDEAKSKQSSIGDYFKGKNADTQPSEVLPKTVNVTPTNMMTRSRRRSGAFALLNPTPASPVDKTKHKVLKSSPDSSSSNRDEKPVPPSPKTRKSRRSVSAPSSMTLEHQQPSIEILTPEEEPVSEDPKPAPKCPERRPTRSRVRRSERIASSVVEESEQEEPKLTPPAVFLEPDPPSAQKKSRQVKIAFCRTGSESSESDFPPVAKRTSKRRQTIYAPKAKTPEVSTSEDTPKDKADSEIADSIVPASSGKRKRTMKAVPEEGDSTTPLKLAPMFEKKAKLPSKVKQQVEIEKPQPSRQGKKRGRKAVKSTKSQDAKTPSNIKSPSDLIVLDSMSPEAKIAKAPEPSVAEQWSSVGAGFVFKSSDRDFSPYSDLWHMDPYAPLDTGFCRAGSSPQFPFITERFRLSASPENDFLNWKPQGKLSEILEGSGKSSDSSSIFPQSSSSSLGSHSSSGDSTNPVAPSQSRDVATADEETLSEAIVNLGSRGVSKLESGHQWTDAFHPSSIAEFCGNQTAATSLRDWLLDWKRTMKLKKKLRRGNERAGKASENSRKSRNCSSSEYSDSDSDACDGDNVFVLSGPFGVGKSCLPKAAARELGFRIIEIGANLHRSGRQIELVSRGATDSHRIKVSGSHSQSGIHGRGSILNAFKVSSSASAPSLSTPKGPTPTAPSNEESDKESVDGAGSSLDEAVASISQEESNEKHYSIILFDDVDVNFAKEDGFWSSIRNIASTARIPVVITCRDESSCELDGISYRSEKLESLSTDQAVLFARSLCQGIFKKQLMPKEAMEVFCSQLKNDLRSILLQLSFCFPFPESSPLASGSSISEAVPVRPIELRRDLASRFDCILGAHRSKSFPGSFRGASISCGLGLIEGEGRHKSPSPSLSCLRDNLTAFLETNEASRAIEIGYRNAETACPSDTCVLEVLVENAELDPKLTGGRVTESIKSLAIDWVPQLVQICKSERKRKGSGRDGRRFQHYFDSLNYDPHGRLKAQLSRISKTLHSHST